MDPSLGMVSGPGNTAFTIERSARPTQTSGPQSIGSGADYAESTTTNENASQRPVRESGEATQLTQEEQTEIRELQSRDREVRAHEAAHRAAAGGLASGGNYTYKRGPDGRSYAVGGEVSIRMPSTNDPRVRVKQAETVRRAALAPADPSPQDRRVAAQAAAMAAQARSEVQAMQRQQLMQSREQTADKQSESGLPAVQTTPIGQRAIASFQAIGSTRILHSDPSIIDEII